MKWRFFSVAWVVFFAGIGFASVTQAATVFRMGDGRYYDPSTGRTASTAEELAFGAATATTSAVSDARSDATTTLDAASSTEAAAAFPLKEAIRRAREILLTEIRRHATSTRQILDRDDDWRSVTLALWNRKTDQIRLVPVWKKGRLVRQRPDDPDIGVSVSNGVNSAFRLDDPDVVVAAIRYPILRDIGTKRKKRFRAEDVVYTPYASALHTTEMVQSGKQLLNGFVSEVYASLEERNILSKAFPDKRLAQVIDRDTAKAVVMIEHVDGAALEHDPKRTVERFYVTLAANGKDAYAYARSNAGASGIVQFMPVSYANFAHRRPELGLEKDFEKGMRDPLNALKAEVAYLDYQLASLSAEDRFDILRDGSKWLEFAVAAYNGGPARVRKTIPSWEETIGESAGSKQRQFRRERLTAEIARLRKAIFAEERDEIWKPMQKKLNGMRQELARIQAEETKARARLKKETIDYVRKYRKAMQWLKTDSEA